MISRTAWLGVLLAAAAWDTGPAQAKPRVPKRRGERVAKTADPIGDRLAARPHVLVSADRVPALRTRRAQVDRLRRVVKQPGEPADADQLLQTVINRGVARHVFTDAAHCAAVDDLLEKTQEQLRPWRRQRFDELPDMTLASALLALSYGYDLCFADLSAARRQAVAADLAGWGDVISEALQPGKWWGTPFGNHHQIQVQVLASIGAALMPEQPRGRALAERARTLYRDSVAPALDIVGGKDGGWSEGISYNRLSAFAVMGTVEALTNAFGEDEWRRCGWLRRNGEYILHHLLPNGRWLAIGDVTADVATAMERIILGRLGEVYENPYYVHGALNLPGLSGYEDHDLFAGLDLLFVDPALPQRPLDSMPLLGRFDGAGLVVMREGWGAHDAVVSFRAGDTLSAHQHADQNAFTIFRGGPLAVDSGVYDDFWSEHSHNYYRRTIAHNSVVVVDPKESFPAPPKLAGRLRSGLSNDGGQRRYSMVPGSVEEYRERRQEFDTGDLEAVANGPGYAYVRGEASRAYGPEKVKRFTRELLFLHRPSLQGLTRLLVFDELVLARRGLDTRWLLHTVEEPLVVDGGTAVVRAGRGEMKIVPLEGAGALETVGGPGREFTVGGRSYAPASHRRQGPPPGRWRLEVRARGAEAELRMTTALLAGPGAAQLRDAPVLTENEGLRVVTLGVEGRPEYVVVGRAGSFSVALPNLPAQVRRVRVVDVGAGSEREERLGRSAARLTLVGRGPFWVTP